MSSVINKLSFVIPNYNGASLMETNLPSVFKTAQEATIPTEVIVIDDASTDNSVKVITEKFPEAKLICNDKNQGFGKTANSGIENASGDVVILLNTDIVLPGNFLSPLLPYFRDPNVFAVSPLIKNEHLTIQRSSWNLIYFKRGEIRRYNWDLEVAIQKIEKDKRLSHLYSCGGAVAMRREYFLKLKGFDDLFAPFYYEDFDLGLRAWQAGWGSYFEPRSYVIHAHRGTIASGFNRKFVKRVERRNRFFLLWIYLSSGKLYKNHIPFIFFRLFTRILTFDINYMFALFDALRQLKNVKRRRRICTHKIDLDKLRLPSKM